MIKGYEITEEAKESLKIRLAIAYFFSWAVTQYLIEEFTKILDD